MTEVKHKTINDVAKASGVSHQTVSRVINNHPHVSLKTKQKVNQAISKLNYKPNLNARHLATGKSNTIGFIHFSSNQYGPIQMMNHIEWELKERNFGFKVVNLRKLSLNCINEAINTLRGQLVDGVILVVSLYCIDLKRIVEQCEGVNLVLLDTKIDTYLPSLAIDQQMGSAIATQFLIDLGHCKICEISGPLEWYDAQLRHQSCQEQLAKSDLKLLAHMESDWTSAGGYNACKQLLAKNKNFTALIVGNDQMALGAMRALSEHNLNVPDDISVIGFDDIPEAAFFNPPLTTIHQDFKTLAKQSVDVLISMVNKTPQTHKQPLLTPYLVERKTTRKA